ncbi:DUF664 domain-containing protein [Lacinutrix sp. WUR7]|uniref:DinB family protein n=1 Tax=Lacinutrix sp. WUR7 TaxID=2653681 RepID=UPI00193D0FE9|nr:DinB family protein [Lacinutrix sp. WUR7]QRM90836.1 DUF664 domain-containing protein [Lacinutrix sp. WUR7]
MDTKENIHRLASFSSKIREVTLKRLQEVPEDFTHWRLNNTAMSFAQIVQHLIHVDELFFSLAESKENEFQWTLGSEEPHVAIDKTTYESMLEKLRNFQQKRYTVICSLDTLKINAVITGDNNEKTTLWWFIMRKVLEHEIYHRGQIAAYLKVLRGEQLEF